MKASHFYILTAIGFLCLLLSIANVVLVQRNQTQRDRIDAQREPLAHLRGQTQILETLVADIAVASEHEPSLRTLLIENGYKFNTGGQ